MLFTSDKMTKSKFSGNSMCHYEIRKEEVDNNDFERINKFIIQLISYRSVPRQKVLFTFAGYESDERQLVSIPEVTKYAKELIKQHPYFWYYATLFNSEFFYLAVLLDESNYTIMLNPNANKFGIRINPEKVKSLIRLMGDALVKFGERINDIDGSLMSLKLWADSIVKSTSR